jgi:hypothetical protein
MPTDQEKQRLAMASTWPVEIAADYFDVSPADVRDLMEAPGAAQVDRFDLEKRLVREDFIGLDRLALAFGVPRDLLEAAMRHPPASVRLAPFPLDAYGKGGRFLLPRKVAEAWVKALLPKHKVWSSLDARARDLAANLGGDVRECAVSKRFGDAPAAVATCRCVVTWDDVSRAHQEYLENRKHISLEPDHVGWHAIADNKVPISALWRTDTTNVQSYLDQHGVAWKAA